MKGTYQKKEFSFFFSINMYICMVKEKQILSQKKKIAKNLTINRGVCKKNAYSF